MKIAVQFGAGNIGRGFIGELLSNSGYHVVFADINEKVINKINEDGQYTVHVYDEVKSSNLIKNVSGMLSNKEDIIEKLASDDVEIITTAVGLLVLERIAPSIAKAISKRMQNNVKTNLNIIACENAINGSEILKKHVYENLNDAEKEYCETYIGFPNCAVDRIVPPVTTENFIDVIVESYYEWDVDKNGFKGDIPEIKGMTLVDNLIAYIERKLFTLNCGHAVTAYLSVLKGHETIDKGIEDPEILEIVKGAMTESGNALIKKYGFDEASHMAYIEKIIKRFKNPYLNDNVKRVGREPIRKLSSNDRLVKPLTTANDFGFSVENLITGIAAAFKYYDENDNQSNQLREYMTELGLKETIIKVTEIKDDKLIEKIIARYNEL